MTQFIYLRSSKGVEAQIWHGPPYLGENMFETNNLGNLKFPSLGGERVIERIDIKDGEERLVVDKLKEFYPLKSSK